MKASTVPIRASLLALTVLASISTVHAGGLSPAAITWGSASAISGDSDISTSGTFVAAYNFGTTGVSDVTVGGITFTGVAFPTNGSAFVSFGGYSVSSGASAFGATNSAATPGSAPFNTLSSSYQDLLGSFGDATSGSPFNLIFTGLTVGQTYAVQIWVNDSSNTYSLTTGASAVNSVSLDGNTTNAVGGLGQFAIGTFTASLATQGIIFSTTGGDQIALNAFQIRNVTSVPEPSAFALMAGGVMLGVAVLRRRLS